jgi:hypothetical protein
LIVVGMSGLWIGKAGYAATFEATGLTGRMARRGLDLRLEGEIVGLTTDSNRSREHGYGAMNKPITYE